MNKFFDVTLSVQDANVLYYACHEALAKWPGSPQRPAKEQEDLGRLKSMFFAMGLETRINTED